MMIKRLSAILVMVAISGGIVWMADDFAMDASRPDADAVQVGQGGEATPSVVVTATVTRVMSEFMTMDGTPIPADMIMGVIDSPPLPRPPARPWSEADALGYSLAWLTAFMPEFSWARAAGRKLSGYESMALQQGWELGSIPTIEPEADPFLHAQYGRSSWWVVFEVSEPMRYRDFAIVLGTYNGLIERDDDHYFTQGLMILDELSGSFTGDGTLNSIDEQVDSRLVPMGAFTFDEFVAIPNTVP